MRRVSRFAVAVFQNQILMPTAIVWALLARAVSGIGFRKLDGVATREIASGARDFFGKLLGSGVSAVMLITVGAFILLSVPAPAVAENFVCHDVVKGYYATPEDAYNACYLAQKQNGGWGWDWACNAGTTSPGWGCAPKPWGYYVHDHCDWSVSTATETCYVNFWLVGQPPSPPVSPKNLGGGVCKVSNSPDSSSAASSSGAATGMRGDPCDAAIGNLFETESDYQSGSLRFTRYYNSQLAQDVNLGFGWTASLSSKRLSVSGYTVQVLRSSGQGESFTCSTGTCTGDVDTHLTLIKDASSYTLSVHQSGSIERYDATGKLLADTNRSGQTTIYGYDGSGRVSTVTGPFGHSLTLGYDGSNHIATVTDAASQVIRYSYDGNHNLTRVDYPDGTAKIYYYENTALPHNLTGIAYVDSQGNTARYSTFSYDNTSGKAVVTERAGGVEHFGFHYDSDTQSTVTDAVSTQEVMTFQTNLGLKNLVARLNQGDGKSLNQVFDAQNNLTCKQDDEGRVTTYSYNGTNQRLSMTVGLTGSCAAPQTTSATRTTTYGYLSATLDLPTMIESPSVAAGQHKTMTIQYGDAAHPDLPTSITQSGHTPAGAAVSRTVGLTYNATGQVSAIDGPRADVADVTSLAYYDCTTGGACGQLKKLTNALGQVTTFDSYDANGRLVQKTDPNGLVTVYTYDPRGRVMTITQTPPTGAARLTQYSYTAAGDVASVRFPDGRTLSYAYDAARLLRQVTDNLGNQVRYGYDMKGNRTQVYTYDPSNTLVRQIDYGFDLRNHLAQVNAAGSLTQQIHDAVGNLVQQVDPNNNPASQYSYDALNRLIQNMDSLGGVSGYGYDTNDKPTQVSSPNGTATQYVYDDLGDLLQETSPDRGTTSYVYDAAGNVTSETDARGITTNYRYDALNRVLSLQYRDGLLGGSSDEDVTYTYDSGTGCSFGLGWLCQVQDQSGLTGYAYDAFGNVVEERHTEINALYVTRYAHDAADRITQITYPDGRVVKYNRDAVGRVSAVSATVNNKDTTITSDMTYRADGLLTGETFSNGISESRLYDLQGRLLSQSIGNVDAWNYGYDANGNLLSRQMKSGTDGYSYDALDRLMEERITQAATISADYQYDDNGNRTAKNTQAYIYLPDTNRLTQVGDRKLTLDAAGNTTDDGAWHYRYSRTGRLEQVRHGHSLKGVYVYNAQGGRTRKQMHGEVTVYHYDLAGNLILETHADGYPIRAYIYAGVIPVAQIDVKGRAHEEHGHHARPYRERLTFLHTDALGTPRLATNSRQAVVWNWALDAFGAKYNTDVLEDTETSEQEDDDFDSDSRIRVNLRFAGMYTDQETGLYYNMARYYDPRIGRYLTSDPIGLTGGLNSYAYTENNPLRWIDPWGLVELAPEWGGGLGGGPGESFQEMGGIRIGTGGGSVGEGASAESAIVARTIAEENGALQSFNNFRQAKNALGTQPGMQLHHVVEQCQVEKSGFPESLVNSTDNLVRLSIDIHNEISAFYSSNVPGTGLRFRDTLTGLPFSEQYSIGMDITNRALNGTLK